jgi:RNA polymerase sigma-70 factor, ECF subfamily
LPVEPRMLKLIETGKRPHSAVTDQQALLCAVAKGDMDAFYRLYQDVSRRLYAVALKILRDHQAAEDALQEIFLRIWRKADKYDPTRGVPIAWLVTIARNTALDMARAQRSFVGIEEINEAEFSTAPIDPPDARLAEGLRRLPPEQANAIIAMYNYGFSHTELAEHLGAPLGTVKSWVRRGTQSLKEWMATDLA